MKIAERLSLPADYTASVQFRETELGYFAAENSLPPDLIAGKSVLDWECGNCAFTLAMLDMGATEVVAIDSWYSDDWLPEELLSSHVAKGRKVSIEGFSQEPGNRDRFDLVFANTVTEHIQDLPSAFARIFEVIKPGGYFFTNHGNYFDPVGSHDHGFLFYNDGGVHFLGPRCWETSNKCATSAEFRDSIRTKYPWTIAENFEATLRPDDCTVCPFYKRAQPWAHLLYQSEFRELFGMPSFGTGRPGSSLNKVSAFQVRQYLIEAGFDIVREHRSTVANDPPKVLMEEPFNLSARELKTAAHRYLVRKPE